MWKPCFLVLAVSQAFMSTAAAQDVYPVEGTVFTTERTYFEPGGNFELFVGPPRQEIIEQVGGTQIATAECDADGQNCIRYVRDSLFITQFAIYDDLIDPAIDMFSDLSDIPSAITINLARAPNIPIFPLENGKVVTWREEWRSDDFSTDYEMRLQQFCCEQLRHDQSTSGNVWQLVYRYDDLLNPEYSNELVYYYDAELKWFVVLHYLSEPGHLGSITWRNLIDVSQQ